MSRGSRVICCVCSKTHEIHKVYQHPYKIEDAGGVKHSYIVNVCYDCSEQRTSEEIDGAIQKSLAEKLIVSNTQRSKKDARKRLAKIYSLADSREVVEDMHVVASRRDLPPSWGEVEKEVYERFQRRFRFDGKLPLPSGSIE